MNKEKLGKRLQLAMVMVFFGNLFPFAESQAGEYEQRVTAECIAKGGDEKVIAACITAKLTEAEIKKCLGMDPGECFGPNNEIRKAVNNTVNDVTKGPGENNDLVGRKGWLRQRLGF